MIYKGELGADDWSEHWLPVPSKVSSFNTFATIPLPISTLSYGFRALRAVRL